MRQNNWPSVHITDKEHLEQVKLAVEEVWDAAPNVESLPSINSQWEEEELKGRWPTEGVEIKKYFRWLDTKEETRLCVETYDGEWVMYFETVLS